MKLHSSRPKFAPDTTEKRLSRLRTLAAAGRAAASPEFRRLKMSEPKESGFDRLKQSLSKHRKFWAVVGLAAVAGGIGYKY